MLLMKKWLQRIQRNPQARDAGEWSGRFRHWLAENRTVHWFAAKKGSILLAAMAFLLGRAMILEELVPFALAFFGVVYFLKRDMRLPAAAALLAGSMFSLHGQTVEIALSIGIFLLIQIGLEKTERTDISYAPIIVFISTFFVQLGMLLSGDRMDWYGLIMAGVESALSFVLTLIFIQAIPVFTLSRKNYSLKNEEIVCLIILLASMMTGTVGWMIQDVSIEHVMSRYLILLFAFVGGAPLGASVGVVTGLILSLANVNAVVQISLLAFAGMLAGLLREGKRPAVALGMLIGSSILSLYVGEQAAIMASFWESLAAAAIFLVTPRGALKTIAKYVPGTQEHVKSQNDYARRVRDLTAGRVKQFSEVFRQLSKSFAPITAAQEDARRDEEVGHFMNVVAERSCAACWKREKCWDDKFYQTYKYMTDMMTEVDARPDFPKSDIPAAWKQACVRTDQVLETMKQQYQFYQHDLHWKKQIQESRKLVADQLYGVSQVMEDLANEIKREGQELFLQEEQIRQALEELGLSIYSIDIISLDEGNVEIEMVHQYNKGLDECRKIIAPLLSDILGENIAVKKEVYGARGDGYYTVTFGSAKEYEVETGIAGAAKGGDLLSGDSFSTIELGNGKYAVALSDGMGNGERASSESRTTLSILQQLLQSGMDEKLAVKSVNSVLLLRSSEEMFATIDVAIIDLYSARTTFLKIGSTPSFIKRGEEVLSISANNLPVGILQDIDVDLVSVQLLPGDTLIMMTDGVFDAPGHAVDKERWMRRVIGEIATDDPQSFADCLLERVVRYHEGEIRDDMTVMVSRIEKYKPEWASFPWPGVTRLERPKTVS